MALQWAERAVALDPRLADAYVIIGGVKQAANDAAAAKARLPEVSPRRSRPTDSMPLTCAPS